MTGWLDDRDALHEQYAAGVPALWVTGNLADRQAFHAEYSIVDSPLREWQFAQFSFPDTADGLSGGCSPGDLRPDVSAAVLDGGTLTLADFPAGMFETASETPAWDS